jgi:hypothetical protein
MIHHLQLVEGLPVSLLSCRDLAKNWIHSEGYDREVTYNLIVEEVRKLLREVGLVCRVMKSS